MRIRPILNWILGLCALVASFAFSFSHDIPLPKVTFRMPNTDVEGYKGTLLGAEPEELAFVYIGASTCGPSNRPELPGLVAKLRDSVAATAQRNHRGFTAIGIAGDMIAGEGLRHLERFGVFDEIMSGRGWSNVGVVKYVYEDTPGFAATPQVLVVRRKVLNGETKGFKDETVLARKVGFTEIQTWLSSGAPLPALTSLTDSSDVTVDAPISVVPLPTRR